MHSEILATVLQGLVIRSQGQIPFSGFLVIELRSDLQLNIRGFKMIQEM